MIAQFLNDDFLLAAAADARRELNRYVAARGRRERTTGGPLEDIDTREIQEVIDELVRALTAEQAAGARGARDGALWMPREPVLAILQSELTRLTGEQQPGVIVADTDAAAVTDVRVDDGHRDQGGERRAFGRYEVTRPRILSDPRWLWSGVVIAWHRFKDRAPFGGLPERPVRIADTARVLLVGDWGSGLPRAQAVARQMRAVIDQGAGEGREQHVVHLGDVYYTGAGHEYRENLLRDWPVNTGEDIGSYALCGNHDMYRGGHDYYGTALGDGRFARQEQRSVFALQNTNWQLLGLDTAWEDGRLTSGQAAWAAGRIQDAPDARTVLLTHHQPWSAHEDTGRDLQRDVAPVLAAGGVDAWFWAHEHRCIVYEPRDHVRFGSCVGHGGIPEYVTGGEQDPYPAGVRYELRRRHGTGLEPWGTFGFAVLDLDGPRMRVTYIDEHGDRHHTEDIT